MTVVEIETVVIGADGAAVWPPGATGAFCPELLGAGVGWSVMVEGMLVTIPGLLGIC